MSIRTGELVSLPCPVARQKSFDGTEELGTLISYEVLADAKKLELKRNGTSCAPRRQGAGATPRVNRNIQSWCPRVQQSSLLLRRRSFDVCATRRAQMRVWAAKEI